MIDHQIANHRRVMDAELLRQCVASGQMDARQIEAHRAAGELDDYPTATGVIAALSGLIGFLALFFAAGGIAWIVWQVLPILRAVS